MENNKTWTHCWTYPSLQPVTDVDLVAVAPSPAEREAVAESMNRDLNSVSVWCDLLGMKLNAATT